MDVDLSALRIAATKPKGKPAKMLAARGVRVATVEEDEGPVDRYIVSKRLAIERRTGSGLLQGIMDKTLFTSAVFLREHFAIPILIVEGAVNYEYSRFDPQAVRGALSAMPLLYGITVLSTPDLEETVEQIVMMTRQEQIGIPEISLTPKRKATSLEDMQRRVVEMLPGCGMVMARDLLQCFGSVSRVVNATEKEFLSLRGIGARKAAEIVRVLNAEYESVDTERNLEDAIEAAPELLFDQPVELLARQHLIYTEEKERHVVDLIFRDGERNELILVELKRGRLSREHVAQLRRYLDNARKSRLLGPLMKEGARVRGVLATVEPCEFDPRDADIAVRIVDRRRAIDILRNLRRERLAMFGEPV